MSNSVTPWTAALRLPCPSLSSRVCSNSWPLVDDAIQPFHPLSPSSPLVLNLFQHQGLFLVLSWWLKWQRIHLQGRRPRFNPWVRKILWRREWVPTPVFLPGEFHGQRNLACYGPWGQRSLVGYGPCCSKKSDMTERLTLLSVYRDLILL